MKYLIALFCLSLTAIANFSYAQPDSQQQVIPLHYKIIAERTHKSSLFTEGFLIHGDEFYESSGLYSTSQIVSYPVIEPKGSWAKMTAPFLKKQKLADKYFAEGLTLLNNKLYLLTWREGTAFVYDADNFSFLKNFHYTGEGWGLANNGEHLIRSDGSPTLYFHNPETFAIEKTLQVNQKNRPIININELEYAEGFIWANIWHDNRIIKISAITGDVVGVLDFSDAVKSLKIKDPENVLNGIAYDPDKKAFWITGKLWPKMLLVKVQ